MAFKGILAFNEVINRLDEYKAMGDPEADSLIANIFSQLTPEQGREVFTALAQSNVAIPDFIKPELDSFAESLSLPNWANEKLMQQGAAFFRKQWYHIQVMLGCYSLPYCYLAKDGVQVLYLSKRLRTDASKRLQETDDFLLRMMLPNAFQNVTSKQIIAKIRLLHAANRYYVFKHANWDAENKGYPINQEDMAGTNLAFSYIVLRGLRKIKVPYFPDEAHTFLHLWNVIGYLLGVKEALLPTSVKEAQMLDTAIATRQFTGSEEGKELTQVLLTSISNNVPKDQAKFIPGYIKYLLGKEKADLLGMENVGSIEPFLSILLLQNRWDGIVGKTYANKPVPLPVESFNW